MKKNRLPTVADLVAGNIAERDTCSNKNGRRKRGRPPTNGVKKSGEFYRAVVLIEAYCRARLEGKTDRDAKAAAITIVQSWLPRMRISVSAIDRALRVFQPKEKKEVFLFSSNSKPDPFVKVLHDGKATIQINFGFGPRPQYPKHRKGRTLGFGRKARP